jgi:V-type H+-transporting ATPase subunit H
VASGRLTWDNPAHSLDEFWKENTSRLLEASANDDYADQSGVTMLINLLSKEDSEPTTLAIACNDIGKIITFSPESGKKQVEKNGGKAKVMELMTHEDGEVKFYALNTVSRLVSASWRG